MGIGELSAFASPKGIQAFRQAFLFEFKEGLTVLLVLEALLAKGFFLTFLFETRGFFTTLLFEASGLFTAFLFLESALFFLLDFFLA